MADTAQPTYRPDQSDPDALRAQLEELERQNAELRARSGPRTRWTDRLRSSAVVLLILLSALCFTAAAPAVWGRNLVLNTDRYVTTVTPLASDPGVQSAITKIVDQQFTANVDVAALVHQALPGRAGNLLASPLQSAAGSLVNTVTTRFLQSAAFSKLWATINRLAHASLVSILTGNKGSGNLVSINNGVVQLNLAPVIEAVKTRLVQAGLTVAQQIPVVSVTFDLVKVKGLTKTQGLVSLFNRVANWLPILGLVFFAAAVLTARRRRRTVIAGALSVAVGMVVVAVGVLIGRHIYVSSLPLRYLTADDAGRIFDTVVRFLRNGLRVVFVVALLVALIAWFTGPTAQARRSRASISRATRSFSEHESTSGVARVIAANRRLIAFVIGGIGALILVLWTNPSAITVLVIVLVTAAVIVLVYSVRKPEPAAQGATG